MSPLAQTPYPAPSSPAKHHLNLSASANAQVFESGFARARSHEFDIGRKPALRRRCRVCASRREQSPLRASARVVLELDFVRAGSRKVPLGHLRSSCLRGVMCERARTKRISSHIGRNLRCVGEDELVCAGSSKPLLGAWMCSSTCAASAAPVAQTAASYTIE